MKENSRDNEEREKPGPSGSGEAGTGPGIPAAEGKKTVHEKVSLHLAERATALRGLAISRPRAPRSTLRRQTLQDIYGKDPEIPYVKFEAAVRDLICSLMERQDRMNEEIFYRINDLGYRLEDLEQDRQAEVIRK